MMRYSPLTRCTKGRTRKRPTIHIGDREKTTRRRIGDKAVRTALVSLIIGHQIKCTTVRNLTSASSMLRRRCCEYPRADQNFERGSYSAFIMMCVPACSQQNKCVSAHRYVTAQLIE